MYVCIFQNQVKKKSPQSVEYIGQIFLTLKYLFNLKEHNFRVNQNKDDNNRPNECTDFKSSKMIFRVK